MIAILIQASDLVLSLKRFMRSKIFKQMTAFVLLAQNNLIIKMANTFLSRTAIESSQGLILLPSQTQTETPLKLSIIKVITAMQVWASLMMTIGKLANLIGWKRPIAQAIFIPKSSTSGTIMI